MKKFNLLITTLLFCILPMQAQNEQSQKQLAQSPLRKLQLAEFAIANLYVDKVDEDKLVEDAIRGMLEKLDPHSAYSNAEEVKKMNEPLQGNFEGIGVQFNMVEDTLFIIQPVSGGPSEKVGILAGDRIVTVNDTTIAGVKMSREEIMRRLRGPKGSHVKLGISRHGFNELLTFDVVRDKIPLHTIDAAYLIRKGIGYVRISSFGATTHTEFTEAISKLKKQGMKHLILDLQGNGGGYLNAAVDIANEFLEADELIVYTEGLRQPRREFKAKGDGKLRTGNVVVLIDEFSASASEIVSGAIQDWDRGQVVGRRSFGKGLVQEPINFTDGSGIRLTVSRFYTPSGRCIQKPYDEDYEYDIYERYAHGEMTSADSMKVDTTVVYYTVKGRRMYGGGGIIPDVFVPIDTTKATSFFISCNKKTTQMRFAQAMADKYRGSLSGISDFETLDRFLDDIALDEQFLEYASRVDGIRPVPGEWEETEPYMMPQLKALVGRFSKLDNEAFYRFYLPIDDIIQAALKN